MSDPRYRVEVMHGVNLDQLGRRDPLLYGTLTLSELERKIEGDARELGLATRFFQTNHEGAFVERLHALGGRADAILLNPGSWTHYAWAIRDALEIAALPAVEVHLSDVQRREPWRRLSVIADLCLVTISGRGPDGYRDALETLREELAEGGS
jgi:3-dehydroquinate dehydratase-2